MKDLHIPHIRLLRCEYAGLFTQLHHWNFPQGSTPYWRLYWNNRTGAAIRSKGQCIKLTPARVILVPPNTMLSTSNHGHVRQLFIHFQILTPYHTPTANIISVPVSKFLKTIIHDIIRLLDPSSQDPRHIALTTHALVALVFAAIMDQAIHVPDIDARILKSLAYLEDHIEASNSALARAANLSSHAFCTLFTAQTGYSPHAYLCEKRIEKACLMLHFSDASIKEIAEETKFCDRYHFSRVFKRIQGMGPAEFRRLNMNPFTPTASSHKQ